MPKKIGIAIVTLGAVLILSALLLLLYNRHQSDVAGQEAENLMTDLEGWMQEQQEPALDYKEMELVPGDAPETEEPELDPEMPVAMVNGYDYVGYLEIPALELKLPVLSQWDYDRLLVAPCRQFGSSRTDDLVIAGHNYQSHFARLKELVESDTVIFTDVEGIENTYAVEKMDVIDPYDVDAVLNSGYDLVLYTCSVGGQTRVAALCNRAGDLRQETVEE